MKFSILVFTVFFAFSCSKSKNISPQTTPTPSIDNPIVYGGNQKDNQYLTKIIKEYRNYTILQKDSTLLTYNSKNQLIGSINFLFRSGYQDTNGYIKKYETTFNYDSKGNLTDCKSIDIPYQYVVSCKFEYDDKNQLSKINGISQTGNYSEFISKLESTDKGFNILRNGFLKIENTIINENLTKYFEKDSPITFEYQDYSSTKYSPYYALPLNMQKVFFNTENNLYFFTLSIEELSILSKNIPSKIISSGAMNSSSDLKTTTNTLGYVTDMSVGDLSTSVYKKYRFSYNNK